jgi:para-nitrobenzyl esterase
MKTMKKTLRKSFISLLMFSFIAILISCSTRSLQQPIQIESGLISGVKSESSNVLIFKGISYAAPPVGNLRWREPQPALTWEGVRTADKFCASCMQKLDKSRLPHTEEFMSQDTISEDCLFLNLWTPARTAEDKLPILVWLHGGGLTEGAGSVKVYDGEELAKKGIIVVTINYRLGVLGFLAHPELTAESPDHVSGNYGLLDQLAALKWVKNNIAAFGGDPDRVTIAGQSAGAGSVRMLTISPLAKGLFHRAVTESGSSFTTPPTPTLSEAEVKGTEFAKIKGVSTLAELRAMSPQELIALSPDLNTVTIMGRFGFNIDGLSLPADVNEIFAEGKQNDTPFITGLNADETRYRGEQSDAFKELYPSSTKEEAAARLKEAGQEQSRLNAYLWLEFRAKTAKTNGYSYFFDRAIPWPEHPEFGAFHTSEVPYVFNNLMMLNRPWEETDKIVADRMSSYWVNFVKTGDPNGPGLPVWAAFDSTGKETMRLGKNTEMMSIAGSQGKFDFLKEQLLKAPIQNFAPVTDTIRKIK